MAQEIELSGVIRGKKTIELDEEAALPDGSRVRVLLVPESAEVVEDTEAEETLRAIYRMRHMGRSILKP